MQGSTDRDGLTPPRGMMEGSLSQRSTEAERKISFARVLVFYVLAIGISNLFRFDLFGLNAHLSAWSGLGYVIIRNVLEGSGVFIGALIGLQLLRKVRSVGISFWGSSRKSVLLMASVPFVLVTAIGVRNNYGINVHLFGAVATAAVLLYCVMEEYGWRGYLQQELGGLRPMLKYALIGTMWYFWHLSFLENTGVLPNLFFFGTLVLGSWGIGQVAVLTRSIGASACFHFLVNISLFNVFFHKAVDTTALLFIISASVAIWIVVLRRWKK